MIDILRRIRTHLLALGIGLFFYLVSLKPVFLHTGGRYIKLFTHAWHAAVAVRDAGITPADPAALPSGFLTWGMVVDVPAGRRIQVVHRGELKYLPVSSEEWVSLPELLAVSGLTLETGEWLFADGIPLVDERMRVAPPEVLEVREGIPVLIRREGKQQEVRVPGPTVGDAVWQAGIQLHVADTVYPSVQTPLANREDVPVEIEIRPAGRIQILVDGGELSTVTSGSTVGEALVQAGVALSGLDYSVPPESSPLPPSGSIRVVRVREELLREQEPMDFETVTQPVEDLELDQLEWIQAGIPGVLENTARVRYEDGVEVSRTPEGTEVAVPPQTRILGYGTKIVIRTMDTPNGPIEYWRSITVYATSYSPCRLGVDPPRCGYITFSGKRVAPGMVAMVRDWYYKFQGQSVYVPNYGIATVEDVGYPGEYFAPFWIDLFYLDEEWINWHQYSTLYFLTPVPANPQYLLQ